MVGMWSSVSRARISCAAVALILMTCGALALFSGHVSAAAFPKIVSGHVYEGDSSHPVVGATVAVEIWNGATLRYTEPSVLTNGAGFYAVSIGGSYWDPGNTIKVTVDYDLNQKSESVVADSGPAQTVDVTFPYAIPQLAGMVGTLTTVVAIGVLAMVLLRRNRQNHKSS
jgi:archaellum component FlaF (FlaF/FlaG flagellin family)